MPTGHIRVLPETVTANSRNELNIRAVISIQCFDTDGLMTGRAPDLQKSCTSKGLLWKTYGVAGLTWSSLKEKIGWLNRPKVVVVAVVEVEIVEEEEEMSLSRQSPALVLTT